jgi:hypothetical protein
MSVLDKHTHARLIAEIDDVARRAGIPRRYIEESMADFCTEQELAWVKGFRTHVSKGTFGLAYVGVEHTHRMMAMCGAFTRNFVLAEVSTLTSLLEELRSGGMPESSVLFIPSMQWSTAKVGLTPLQLNLLWNLLEDRMINEKQTVIGIQSLSDLKAHYGGHFGSLIDNHYEVVVE